MLNKKYLVGIGIAVIIGIAVTVYGYSMNQQGSTANNSVGVSDNVQVTKTSANATTGKHFSVQFSESMGVSNKP